MALKNKKLILLLIIVLAVFFRFYQLDSIPPGLYPDEAMNANDAFFSLKNNSYRIFYPENTGREGLFIWLISASFSILGVSVLSLKLVPALIGSLTVLGIYLLAKELFSKESIALLSSFFLSVSFWHVNFSRIAFRGIFVPFILVFFFYFLLKGFKKQDRNLMMISGIVFGLGFYTYSAFRVAVLLPAAALLLFCTLYKKQKLQKKFLELSAYFILSVIVISLPIGIYFMNNPDRFLARTSEISVFSQENPLQALGKSLMLHLGMFNFYGDPNWRHNYAGSPMLFWPVGILFLIGIIASIKSLKQKNSSFPVILLLLWLAVMLAPGFLTHEGMPHSLRAIGTIPAAYIFAALGAYNVFNLLDKKADDKRMLRIVCLLFLAFTAVFQFQKYFHEWAGNEETKNAFSNNYARIAQYINSLPEETQRVVVVNAPGVPVPYPNGLPVPAQTIVFLESAEYGRIRSYYVLEKDIASLKAESPGVIIPMQYSQEFFEKLKALFPQGNVLNINGISAYEL